ncbi:hypothetical protein BWK58_14285 [Flavobacterium columnare]|nr:hypothetical protein BWK58_14285 [Flavobacterium columnare]
MTKLFLSVMLCLSVLSCTRDDNNVQLSNSIEKSISGKWILKKVTSKGIVTDLSNCQNIDYSQFTSGNYERKYYGNACGNTFELIKGSYSIDESVKTIKVTYSSITEILLVKELTANKFIYTETHPETGTITEFELVK